MFLPSFQFERPACALCGTKMHLARREPHPTLGSGSERVTFECPNCMQTHTRAESVELQHRTA
jgi:hypothetical protein